MTRAQWIRGLLAVLLGVAGLAWMNSLGALQLPSVLVYSGLVLVGFGAVTFLLPPRWSGFRRRVDGLATGAALGGALLAAGWFWPPRTHIATPANRIDAFMPRYDFQERHEILVRATPSRVRAAFENVSLGDTGAMQMLGRIRAIAMGDFRAPRGAPRALNLVEMIRSPRSGFFPLDDSPSEFVFGLAGQPWNNRGVRLRPDEFRGWALPGNVKIAANFLIEDAGAGRTRVTTETRVLASDDATRRKMARYWAFIYPGSGMIRRGLLAAIRDTAEARQ